MPVSRREFIASAGAVAASLGAPAWAAGGSYRATVGVFLYGGNDGWNMIVPADARHAAYRAARGALAIPAAQLSPLAGTPFALHPAMAALEPLWDAGALALVLDAGAPARPAGHWEAQRRWPRATAIRGSLGVQLAAVARTIASRAPDAAPEAFRVIHGGYDTHAAQGPAHAALLGELARATAAFCRTMAARGLDRRVTLHTMTDFGRDWTPNAAGGSEHGWASCHFVAGGALAPRRVHGVYPEPGALRAPALTQADYLSALAGTGPALRVYRA